MAYGDPREKKSVRVSRNVYLPDGTDKLDKEGNPVRIIEDGWTTVGDSYKGGKRYIRVERPGEGLDPKTGESFVLRKDFLEETLDGLQRTEERGSGHRNVYRDSEIGRDAVLMGLGSLDVDPGVASSDWALTPEQHRQLLYKIEADAAASVKPNIITGLPKWTEPEEPVVAAPETMEQQRARIRSAMDELTHELSKNDVDRLWRYSRACADRKKAQQDGNEYLANSYKATLDGELRSMSKAARLVADRYRDLWDQL